MCVTSFPHIIIKQQLTLSFMKIANFTRLSGAIVKECCSGCCCCYILIMCSKVSQMFAIMTTNSPFLMWLFSLSDFWLFMMIKRNGAIIFRHAAPLNIAPAFMRMVKMIDVCKWLSLNDYASLLKLFSSIVSCFVNLSNLLCGICEKICLFFDYAISFYVSMVCFVFARAFNECFLFGFSWKRNPITNSHEIYRFKKSCFSFRNVHERFFFFFVHSFSEENSANFFSYFLLDVRFDVFEQT